VLNRFGWTITVSVSNERIRTQVRSSGGFKGRAMRRPDSTRTCSRWMFPPSFARYPRRRAGDSRTRRGEHVRPRRCPSARREAASSRQPRTRSSRRILADRPPVLLIRRSETPGTIGARAVLRWTKAQRSNRRPRRATGWPYGSVWRTPSLEVAARGYTRKARQNHAASRRARGGALINSRTRASRTRDGSSGR
jgi:hypothetical protein